MLGGWVVVGCWRARWWLGVRRVKVSITLVGCVVYGYCVYLVLVYKVKVILNLFIPPDQ